MITTMDDSMKETRYERVFVFINASLFKIFVFYVCECACVCDRESPVTALVSEVLNNDRNSRYLLTPAAPITGEENTMVSTATQTSASSPSTCAPPPHPLQN